MAQTTVANLESRTAGDRFLQPHRIASREEGLVARTALLTKEKELTRAATN